MSFRAALLAARRRACLRDCVCWVLLASTVTACTGSSGRAGVDSASALPAAPLGGGMGVGAGAAPKVSPAKPAQPKVIVCVWDGLRPDSISAEVTPNLARLRDREGVNFSDH